MRGRGRSNFFAGGPGASGIYMSGGYGGLFVNPPQFISEANLIGGGELGGGASFWLTPLGISFLRLCFLAKHAFRRRWYPAPGQITRPNESIA